MTSHAESDKVTKQHVAVPLLEGAHSSVDALTFRDVATIGGIECHVLLPGPHPAHVMTGGRHLQPPYDEHHERDPNWPDTDWGYIHDPGSVTIQAVGLILVQPLGWGEKLIDFDHAVGQWRHLLRDWLSVIAEGPTDFLELPVRGETRWAEKGYTNEVWSNYYDNLQWPQRVSGWQWEHVLAHIRTGDQPPLARVLLTTAKRAAATGNSRLAVIDAATAAEVALTSGLTDRLSTEASSQVAQMLIERTRMLGPRLDLAKDLGMALPDRIRADLVDRRNAVIHRGAAVTDADAHAAITAAGNLVDEYEPLAAHCREPSRPSAPVPSPPSDGWDDEPPF
jgi:hypothetical protein